MRVKVVRRMAIRYSLIAGLNPAPQFHSFRLQDSILGDKGEQDEAVKDELKGDVIDIITAIKSK